GAPMNRIKNKCFIASAGLHLSLLVILFVGPAFLSSSKQNEARPQLDFVAFRTVEDALAGGGSPNASPPAPAPTPAPAPPKVETPQLPPPAPKVEKVESPKTEAPDRDALEVKPAKKLPNVNLKQVTRPKNASANTKPTTD